MRAVITIAFKVAVGKRPLLAMIREEDTEGDAISAGLFRGELFT
jgi:hypothetical protein